MGTRASLEIEALALTVPGLSQAQAAAVGEGVLHRLASRMPADVVPQRRPSVQVALTVSPDLSQRQLIDAIAEAVANTLW